MDVENRARSVPAFPCRCDLYGLVAIEEGGLEFEVWYCEVHPRLIGALLWITGDADQAWDAVDEACARALARWVRLRSMDSPTGWTYQVALNGWRRTQRRSTIEHRLLRRHHRSTVVVAGPAGETWDLLKNLPARVIIPQWPFAMSLT